jgi:hypothetical protein
MTSEQQIRANRRNAQLSTGPATPEGKAASRNNAFRHGLRSRDIVIAGEDPEMFAYLKDELEAELEPVGFQEAELVERIAVFMWRLRRLHRVEAGIFAAHSEDDSDMCGRAFIWDANGANAFTKLSRYETMMERTLSRLRTDLERLQKSRADETEEHPMIIDHAKGPDY